MNYIEFLLEKFVGQELDLQEELEIISIMFVFIGGCFALYQWRKSLVQKRAEAVEKLIKTVRDDEDISTIMDIIDWDEGFGYNGNFYVIRPTTIKALENISDDELFRKIDKTLAHFSHICYLKNQRVLTKKDMRNFEYEIRRLADNEHIANYMHSLYLWSSSLNVSMSFSYLLDYCIRKKYLTDDIKNPESEEYENYL